MCLIECKLYVYIITCRQIMYWQKDRQVNRNCEVKVKNNVWVPALGNGLKKAKVTVVLQVRFACTCTWSENTNFMVILHAGTTGRLWQVIWTLPTGQFNSCSMLHIWFTCSDIFNFQPLETRLQSIENELKEIKNMLLKAGKWCLSFSLNYAIPKI